MPKSAGNNWEVVPTTLQAARRKLPTIRSQKRRRSTWAIGAAPTATKADPSGADNDQTKPTAVERFSGPADP